MECLRGFQLADVALSHERVQAKPSTIEYSPKEVESAQPHLEVFAKHSREYMVKHGQ